jgi:hypothetical protein
LETQSIEETVAKSPDMRLHYAMIDGSMVFIRGKKNGLVAHLGNSDDFLNKFEHLVSCKSNLVAISDGARWIWEYWGTFHPQAIQILDFFHLTEKNKGLFIGSGAIEAANKEVIQQRFKLSG